MLVAIAFVVIALLAVVAVVVTRPPGQPWNSSLNCEPGYPARGRSLLHISSLNCEPGYPARGRFAPSYFVAQLRAGIPGSGVAPELARLVAAPSSERETLAPSAASVPLPRPSAPPARRAPPDADALGVTRRQFLNRSLLGGAALGLGAFGSAALSFLWPSAAPGSGARSPWDRHRTCATADRGQAALLQRDREDLHRAVPEDGAAEGEEDLGIHAADHRGNGGGVRRALPDLPAPRLPSSVVRHVTVVRVPLSRIEVQRGGGEARRPGTRGMDRFVLPDRRRQHRGRHGKPRARPADRYGHHRPEPPRGLLRVSGSPASRRYAGVSDRTC